MEGARLDGEQKGFASIAGGNLRKLFWEASAQLAKSKKTIKKQEGIDFSPSLADKVARSTSQKTIEKLQ